MCDLTKQHLNLFVESHAKLSAQKPQPLPRHAANVSGWCRRRDYLAANHRLFEADGLRKEDADTGDVDYYRPAELRLMLDNAAPEMAVIIAMQAFGGLRVQETLRLDWGDVWRVAGYMEISSAKSKTRQRRLVEICPALAAWLKPCRKKSGKVFPGGVHVYQRGFLKLRGELKIPDRRNGLRHAFCTYHFALHNNENLTAAQAGNSPSMIHAHYKGLATKAEAEKWFAVQPQK